MQPGCRFKAKSGNRGGFYCSSGAEDGFVGDPLVHLVDDLTRGLANTRPPKKPHCASTVPPRPFSFPACVVGPLQL